MPQTFLLCGIGPSRLNLTEAFSPGYIMSAVNCSGEERSVAQCPHDTQEASCDRPATVTCVGELCRLVTNAVSVVGFFVCEC